jgi:hypothetical protein
MLSHCQSVKNQLHQNRDGLQKGAGNNGAPKDERLTNKLWPLAGFEKPNYGTFLRDTRGIGEEWDEPGRGGWRRIETFGARW